MSDLATQVGSLGRRSIVRQMRQPAHIIPPITFPLGLMAVNAGGLDAATRLPGFPSDSFLAFALAVPFIQGALFATLNGGADFARDIQTGFLNRLSLTPMRGVALIAGHLSGVVAQGVFQASVYLAVGLSVGVHLESGALGAVVLMLLAALVALGFGAVGTLVALRTGSGEATQAMFPLFFVFLFISSMNMPRDLIEQDWFRIAASVNPVSYLIEGVRSLIISGWDAQALALAFGVAALIAIGALALAAKSLRLRLTRT
jgi:ABC-2 type transport system permease protein